MFVTPVIVDTGAHMQLATTAPAAAMAATVAPAIMANVFALTFASEEELVDAIDSAVSEGCVCAVTGAREVVETISSHRAPV